MSRRAQPLHAAIAKRALDVLASVTYCGINPIDRGAAPSEPVSIELADRYASLLA